MKNTEQNRCWHVLFMLAERVLARWWHPVASSETLDPLHWPTRAVSYRRIAMSIETARKVGVFIHHCVVDCRPGVRRSDMEQVVARWRRLVALNMALDILHQAMLH
jgi:hypothetical protein